MPSGYTKEGIPCTKLIPKNRLKFAYTKERNEKIRKSQMGKNNSMFGKNRELASNWKGGKTDIKLTIRKNYKYRQWRSDVFQRDNFTCQECGTRGVYLEAHHYLKRFADILDEYKIKTLEQAYQCEELWNINNGISMCRKCHDKTKTNR